MFALLLAGCFGFGSSEDPCADYCSAVCDCEDASACEDCDAVYAEADADLQDECEAALLNYVCEATDTGD